MQASRRGLTLLTSILVLASVLVVQPAPVAAGTTAAAPAGYVTPVSAGSLAEVVVHANGTAYATNPWQNRVEVLTVATGALGTPIPVGTEPRALDLSADGTKLYVANAEGNDVSVVDLVQRRELRRIALPPAPSKGRPTSIAVADNGMALVTRSSNGSSAGARLLQIDLAAESVRERLDWRDWVFGAEQSRVRASRDRSRIGIAHEFQGVGDVGFYDAASDGFTPAKTVGKVPFLAVDATGSTVLAGADTVVVDGDLALHATIPGPGSRAVALSASGATGYRLKDTSVEVLNVERAVVEATIALPDSVTYGGNDLALTPDDATLVVPTGRGFSAVPVGSAVAVPCTRPATPTGVVAVCGAPLADVVIDGRNRAYASNPGRNQIEVVSLATRTLEAPIPVGSQPTSLAVSPDRNTLYVANSGAEDVSVVDLTLRREVRRISVAAPRHGPVDRPLSIAVANNGTALLTTRALFPNGDTRLLQVDLAAGTFQPRMDQTVGKPQVVEASGDGSRIGVVPGGPGAAKVAFYDADADAFTTGKEVSGGLTYLALDGTGSKLLVGPGSANFDPGTYVLDGELVRRATLATVGAVAVNGPGTTSYQVQWSGVNVIDMARALAVRSIPLPEVVGSGNGDVALSPDGVTIAVLTGSGISVVPVSAAVPVPRCTPANPRPMVAAICGTSQGEVVIGATGHAYVSNPDHNRIEVVSLATGKLEAPIPVASRPRGLDLDIDGTKLYVASTGAEEISVVDVALRREVRRITVPSVGFNDRPYSIAVADNHTALVTTTFGGYGYGGHLLHVDLNDGTVQPRVDYGSHRGTLGTRSMVKASGDRSHIAIVEPSSAGEVSIYTSASDTVSSPPTVLNDYLSYAALDDSGSKVLLDPGGYLLDGEARLQGDIPTGGKGVAVNRAGTTGFRVQDTTVEVLDLERRVIARSLPLPEAVGPGRGSIALSPDGATLAVITASGVSMVKTGIATLPSPFSEWAQPSSAPLDGIGSVMAIVNNPTAAPGQRPPSYLYGHYFGFADSPASGVVGLMTGPAGKLAIFTIVDPDGTAQTVAVPYSWTAGRYYFTFVYQLAPGVWGAWVYDYLANAWAVVGQLAVPAAWGKLAPTTTTRVIWYGPQAPTCSAYPRADVLFAPPMGYAGATASSATLSKAGARAGDCPVATSYQVWARYVLGAEKA